MIGIYSEFNSSRLKYICDYIFNSRYKTDYVVVHSLEDFAHDFDFKINYSHNKSLISDIHITPSTLLSENNIHKPDFHVHRWKQTMIPFYNSPGAVLPFDIFSATFYYLSRYEEYVTEKKDKHNRFPFTESLSHKFNSIHQPVVDIWLMHFKSIINTKAHIISHEDKHELSVTFDIDLLYKYKYKSIFKKIGGTLKDLMALRFKGLSERLQVYQGKKEDPFFSFHTIHDIVAQSHQKLMYFLLMKSDGRFDQMHDLSDSFHQKTIQSIHKTFPIHLHPSYDSIEKGTLGFEKNLLEDILGVTITKSRQHFIKVSLPSTYRALLDMGILEDYSMGYPEVNGFRAGTSRPFYWFDLEKNEHTELLIHPFTWMDATCLFYNKKHSLKDITNEWNLIQVELAKTEGIMCPIFHNYIIGDKLFNRDYYIFFKKLFE